MCKPFKLFLAIAFLFSCLDTLPQDKTSSTENYHSNIQLDFGSSLPDYKILASNNSYIEIEFYPQYSQPEKFIYDNETFIRLTFENAKLNLIGNSGKPNIGSRVFSVILPSEEGNKVSVVDYDVRDANNINLAPIPTAQRKDPNRRDFENTEYAYIKDNNVYSQNKYFPEQIASIESAGLVRETSLGILLINPLQYNPASKTLKQYTRIRVRVNFGSSPVLINRKRSIEETGLLKDLALNSNIALNWMSPKAADYKQKASFNSQMASGDWYKIEIKDNTHGESSGIYKISKSFLESAGINLTGVNPKTIKMYGNGGELLPEDLSSPRPVDLDGNCHIYRRRG